MDVSTNTFYSPRSPSYKIQVDKEFKYVGMFEERKKTSDGTSYSVESYVFVKADVNSRVISGFNTTIFKLNSGSWSENIFETEKNKLIDNNTNLGRNYYDQMVKIFRMPHDNHYSDNGYVINSNVVIWAIGDNLWDGRFKNKDVRMNIYYFEDINRFNELAYSGYNNVSLENPGKFKWLEDEVLLAFISRARDVFTISEYTPAPPTSYRSDKTQHIFTSRDQPAESQQLAMFKSKINNSTFLVDTKKWESVPVPNIDKGTEYIFKRRGAEIVVRIDTTKAVLMSPERPSDWHMWNTVLMKKMLSKDIVINHNEIKTIHSQKVEYMEIDYILSGQKFKVFVNISSNESGGTVQIVLAYPSLEKCYQEDIDEFLGGLYVQ